MFDIILNKELKCFLKKMFEILYRIARYFMIMRNMRIEIGSTHKNKLKSLYFWQIINIGEQN